MDCSHNFQMEKRVCLIYLVITIARSSKSLSLWGNKSPQQEFNMAGALEFIGQWSSVPLAISIQVFLVLISYQLGLAINL